MTSVLLSSTFFSEADRLFLSASPAVFVASHAPRTEDHVSPAERERVRKLIHRLHVAGGHVLEEEFQILASASRCSTRRPASV